MKTILCAIPLLLCLIVVQKPAQAQNPLFIQSYGCSPSDCESSALLQFNAEVDVYIDAICNNGVTPIQGMSVYVYNCYSPQNLLAEAGLAIEYVFQLQPDGTWVPVSVYGVSAAGSVTNVILEQEEWYGYTESYCNGDGDSYYSPPMSC